MKCRKQISIDDTLLNIVLNYSNYLGLDFSALVSKALKSYMIKNLSDDMMADVLVKNNILIDYFND